MKAFKEPINYESLEEELNEALKADELYNLQNDAKFRAIEQSVPSYEDFRQMVNAAHLKPLNRKDMAPKKGVKWNSIVNDRKDLQSVRKDHKEINYLLSDKQVSGFKLPTTSAEFQQRWKRLDRQEKFRLLSQLRFSLNTEIFRSEIPPDILIDCLVTCHECLDSVDNKNFVIDILCTLSECNRFKLAVQFMSKEDNSLCRELFQALRKAANLNDDKIIDNLEKKYLS